MMRALRRFGRCRCGSAAVEFAIISQVLVLLTLGIIEFGRGLNLRKQLSHAADFGARQILVDKTVSNSTVESVVRSAFFAGDPKLLAITIGVETVAGAQFRTVAISYPFTPLIPGLSDKPISLKVARRTPVI